VEGHGFSRAVKVEGMIWALAPEVCFFARRLTLQIDHLTDFFNRNPSSSNKTRTADTSSCTGSPATWTNSSDNTAPDRPFSFPPHARSHALSAPSVPGSYPPTVSRAPATRKYECRFRSGRNPPKSHPNSMLRVHLLSADCDSNNQPRVATLPACATLSHTSRARAPLCRLLCAARPRSAQSP
jgi:hypothetical protein